MKYLILWCSVLQWVVACCSVLQYVAMFGSNKVVKKHRMPYLCRFLSAPEPYVRWLIAQKESYKKRHPQHTATSCNTPQHPATHCNIIWRKEAYKIRYCMSLELQHCTTPHHTAPHCTTLHHTAPHCTKLHHTASHCTTLHRIAPQCTTLHRTAPHCTTLEYTATHCNTLHHTARRHTAPHSMSLECLRMNQKHKKNDFYRMNSQRPQKCYHFEKSALNDKVLYASRMYE